MNRRLVMTMTAMSMGVIVIAMDITAMNVALSAIERAFDSDVTETLWVINGYLLAFGMLIVTGGRLSDIFGKRRLFFVGLFLFGVTSLAGGLAPTLWLLVVARILQGMGGALLWPAILGISYLAVPEEKRGLAVGIILGAAALGNALGPVIGGILTELVSWRCVLLVNVPMACFAGLITLTQVTPDQAGKTKERIDYPGILSLSVALAAVMLAIDEAGIWGWLSSPIIILLIIGALFFAGFTVTERRVGYPVVPHDVMSNKTFLVACIITGLMAPSIFANFFYLPQYMEKFLHFSTLRSGVGILPMLVTFACVSPFAGNLYNRLGGRLLVIVGAVCMAVGTFLFSLLAVNSGYTGMIPGMIIFGAGLGVGIASITTVAVGALDVSKTGLAGGLTYMFQLSVGSLGLAFTTMIYIVSGDSRVLQQLIALGTDLSGPQRHLLRGILTGTDSARQLLSQFDGETARRLAAVVQERYVLGLRDALLFDAILAGIAALLAIIFIRGGRTKETAGQRGNIAA
ncbi:MAG TPA: DHA2 family efflux MFS transporter permease subunit [Syntrophorhabdales bacterium]|nr:DHA2 family efflux MFS transporter permease subunit [Syntrophorhabdales bacterium]